MRLERIKRIGWRSLLLLAVCISLSHVALAADFPKGMTLFFRPNADFNKDGAQFEAELTLENGSKQYVDCNKILTPTGNYEVFRFVLPAGDNAGTVSSIRIVRGGNGSNGYERWNYTKSLEYEEGKNCITMGSSMDNQDWQNAPAFMEYCKILYFLPHSSYEAGNAMFTATNENKERIFPFEPYDTSVTPSVYKGAIIADSKSDYENSSLTFYRNDSHDVSNPWNYTQTVEVDPEMNALTWPQVSGAWSGSPIYWYTYADWYIRRYSDGNDYPKEDRLKLSALNSLLATVDGWQNGNYGFKLNGLDDNGLDIWYRYLIDNPDASANRLVQNTAYHLSKSTTTLNNFLVNEATGKNVTFVVSLSDLGMPLTITPVWEYNRYALKKYIENSSDEFFIDFEWDDAKNCYVAMIPSTWYGNTFHLRAAFTDDWYNDIWFGKQDDKNYWVTDNASTHSFDIDRDENGIYFNCEDDYEVRLTCVDGKGSAPKHLEFVKIVPEGMPFYPNGISENEFDITDNTSKYYYLVGHDLNNGLPSPEWQMEGPVNGKYTIDFTYSKHTREFKDNAWTCSDDSENLNKAKVVYFTPADAEPVDVKEGGNYTPINVNFIKAGDGTSYEKAGVRLRATFDPADNSIKFDYLDYDDEVVTITSDEDYKKVAYLPMITLIGENWKQPSGVPVHLNVPKGNKFYDNNWENTGVGWQQSWIQYGADGNPVVSRDGRKVYFNTQWPPKEGIKFETKDDKGNTLYINSKDLTFIATGESHNAAYWQENGGFPDVDFTDDNAEYMLYEVSDMWITGDFKLWTGWNSSRTSNDGSGAEWNWNWGHHEQQWWPATWNLQETDQYNKEALNGAEPELASGTGTVHLGVQRGDMKFIKPTYFSKVYFFLDLTHPNNEEYRHSLLYFERGDLSISAMSQGNLYGMFSPGLHEIDADQGESITKITLKVYKDNEAKELVETFIDSKAVEPGTITDDASLKSYFARLYGEGSVEDYLLDGKEDYESGWYYYTLEATVSSSSDAIADRTLYAKSNSFRIIRDEISHTLTAAQLIKLENLDADSPFAGYDYITYSSTFDGRLVNTETVDDKITVAKIDNVPSTVDRTLIRDVYENTGIWTNKILLRTHVPAALAANGEYEVQEGSLSYKVVSVAGSKTDIEMDNVENGAYYATVIDRTSSFGATTYQSALDANVRIADETGDRYESIAKLENISVPNGRTSLTPSFMIPSFGKAGLSFDEEKSQQTGSTVMDFTASHEDLQYSLGDDDDERQQAKVNTNRHMLQADIEVLMPNVEAEIRQDVFDNLTIGISKDNVDYAVTPVASAPPFGLSYKYQNPYDWMKEENDDKHDAARWVGIPNTWTLQAAYKDNAGIHGVERSNAAYSATIEANPRFSVPELSNSSFTYDPARLMQGYFDLYLSNVDVNLNLDPEQTDNLDPDEENWTSFAQNAKSVFLVKLTSTIDGVEYVSKVMDYENGSISSPDEPILSMNAGEIQGEGSAAGFPAINAAMKDLEIEVAYAYYFSAGGEAGYDGTDDPEIFDAAASSSGWKGFATADNSFPYMRSDHGNTGDANKIRRRVAESDATDVYPETSENYDTTKGLMKGDNAYLLAPVYAVLKAHYNADESDDVLDQIGLPTGIEGLASDNATVLIGKGFIDLNGNTGIVYAADGNMVYNGNSRINLMPGIYVITFGNYSIKTLVK